MVKEIAAKAKEMARPKLLELQLRPEEAVLQLETQRQALEKQIAALEVKHGERERPVEELMSGVAKRLRDGRGELLSELALLGPLFQGGITNAPASGRVDSSSCRRFLKGRTPFAAVNQPSDAPSLKSPALEEIAFVNSRLWPCLANRGCSLGPRRRIVPRNDAGRRFIGIPHPGWAVGYAEAMGGTALATTVTASPSWLSFDSAFVGGLIQRVARSRGLPFLSAADCHN